MLAASSKRKASSASTVAFTARARRARSQRSAGVRASSAARAGSGAPSRFMSAKRVAFQSLFAKARLPSMRSRASLMSRPWALVSAARVKRSASAPYFSVMSSGSMTLPFVFDIFCPFSSRTMG